MNVPSEVIIRPLAASDVSSILDIISGCRREYGLDRRVHALLEPNDLAMWKFYQQHKSRYFVAVTSGSIAGGAGIAPLGGDHHLTCELQRMYLRPENRGQGVGGLLLDACVQAARQFGFARCYAETVSEMAAALAFYQRSGFQFLPSPMGNTGHNHNDRWMLLDIAGRGCGLP